MPVNPFSVIPKYHQLSDILRQRIEDGEWKPREPIPAERELQLLYGVSRTTVREAMRVLEEGGYIYREHGRGTFVARPKMQYSISALNSFTEDMRIRGRVAGQQLLSLRYVDAPLHMLRHMESSSPVPRVVCVERLRYADGEPVGIQTAYLPLSPDQTIRWEELESAGSLYGLLEQKFNLVPAEADETVEATLANERESAILGVPPASPLLLIQRTTWSQRRQLMEYVKMVYRADRYKWYNHISR